MREVYDTVCMQKDSREDLTFFSRNIIQHYWSTGAFGMGMIAPHTDYPRPARIFGRKKYDEIGSEIGKFMPRSVGAAGGS